MPSNDSQTKISFIDFGFHMEPPLKAAIKRDCGLYYKRKGHVELAEVTFDEALEDNPECFQSMYEKSRCQLKSGHPEVALKSAEKCIECFPDRIRAQRHRNACMFDQNRFEESLAKMARTRFDFPKVQRHQDDGMDVALLTIEETIGTSKGPCLLNMRKDIEKYDAHRKLNVSDDRPMWKVAKEKDLCDVVSVIEKPKRYISKMNQFREQRKKSNVHAMYLRLETSKDILFLEKLEKDKRLMLNHTQNFNRKVGETIATCLKEVRDFEDMLRHRQPIYASVDADRQQKKIEYAENGLTRIQAKTRREAFAQLVEIKRLAAARNMLALSKRVSNIMENFYCIKTKRVFPRKFEFMSEIFNIVGNAYLRNAIKVPNHVALHQPKEQLLVLLQLPYEKKTEESSGKVGERFGDKSAFVDPTAPDLVFLKYKKRTDQLDKDIQRCVYPIEGCYLCYELAHLHIAHSNLEEPKVLANKLLAFAEQSGNVVWVLLGHLTGARADLISGQVVGCGQRLQKMKDLVEHFDDMVSHFISTALVLHENRTREEEKL